MAIGNKPNSPFGKQGLAEVRILKTGVRVLFQDNSNDIFDIQNTEKKAAWEEGRPGGMFRITLNRNNDRIFMVRPPEGVYVFSFTEFARGYDQQTKERFLKPPKIQRGGKRNGKNGTWYQPDRMVATARCTVHSSDKKYNDLVCTVNIPYTWQEGMPGDGAIFTGEAYEVAQLQNFLDLGGVDFEKDTVPYSENVLPVLEHLMQRETNKFTSEINEGGFMSAKSFARVIVE